MYNSILLEGAQKIKSRLRLIRNHMSHVTCIQTATNVYNILQDSSICYTHVLHTQDSGQKMTTYFHPLAHSIAELNMWFSSNNVVVGLIKISLPTSSQ